MDTAKVMEILKKNALSIACAVIALLAVVAVFWPVGGMFATLKTQADQHAGLYNQLTSLLTKPRNLPLTDPSQTQQEPLSIFPNEKTIDVGTQVTKQVSEQSKAMVKYVNDLNQRGHGLLVPGSLPEAASDTPKFRFSELYKLVLNTSPDLVVSMATDPKLRDAKVPNIANDILNAGVPPTELQITDAKTKLWNDKFQVRVYTVNGQPVNQPQILAEFQIAEAKLPDEMKLDVAKQKKIYLAVDALQLNPNVTAANVPATVDIWYAQQELWIQQDVAMAIAEANAKATCILDAPVKHLVKLSIPQPPAMYAVQAAAAAAGGVPPAPVPVDGGDTQPLPKVTADPSGVTGRVSNPMYDVVRFTLAINVDASQVPAVIAALTANRLMDVYNMDVVAVDSTERANAGFIYGPDPVVTLNLKCESLFMRAWTAPLMPDRIKTAIGIATAPPPVPGAPAAQ